MTKEEILDNNLLNDGGLRRRIFSAMDEYAKQQVILFVKQSIKSYVLAATIDESVCCDGFEYDHPAFESAISDRYDQFIEQQNKE